MAATLAIPILGLALGLAFAVVALVLILIVGLSKGGAEPGELSLAMFPFYYGWLGVFWALSAMLGVLPALPLVVFGEMRAIRGAAYYVLVGGVAAAVGRAVAAYFLGDANLLFEGAGFTLIVPATYGAITGGIYWRFVGRNAGPQTVASA